MSLLRPLIIFRIPLVPILFSFLLLLLVQHIQVFLLVDAIFGLSKKVVSILFLLCGSAVGHDLGAGKLGYLPHTLKQCGVLLTLLLFQYLDQLYMEIKRPVEVIYVIKFLVWVVN